MSRLLFVSVGLSPRGGGIASAARLLLGAVREWASDRNVALSLFTLGGEEEIPPGVRGRAFRGNRAALARAVWRAQLQQGFDHQVYDFLGIARIQGLLPRVLRARYLLYVYGIEVWRELQGTRRRALDGAAIRLACSAYTVARMRRHNPETRPITPLHLAVGADEATAPVDEGLLAAVGEGFVLIVGRLDENRYKGHDDLLEAVSRLAPRRPGLRLVIAGEGRDLARLRGKTAALGIADRVHFTGFVEEATLRALYARCSVFAMPSEGEGFGLVYLEAMRAGKPCIALRGSAAAEVVLDGVTGRLVEPGVESLNVALDALAADPAASTALGAAGHALWRDRFQPPLFAERLRPHLDHLLDGTEA